MKILLYLTPGSKAVVVPRGISTSHNFNDVKWFLHRSLKLVGLQAITFKRAFRFLDRNCLRQNVIYQATVMTGTTTESYIGLSSHWLQRTVQKSLDIPHSLFYAQLAVVRCSTQGGVIPTPRIELHPPHLALEKKHVSRAKILRSSLIIAFSAVVASCSTKLGGVAWRHPSANCRAKKNALHHDFSVNLFSEGLPSCVARRPLLHKVNLPRCEARRRFFITGLNSIIYIIYILLPCFCIIFPRFCSVFNKTALLSANPQI